VWSARAGDGERAIALVKRVLDDAPTDTTALRALLAAQEAATRWDEVGKTLQKMIEGSKPAESVPLWIELAELRKRRLGKIEDAIAAWRSALAIEPTHPIATRELAQALRARGEHKAVAELGQKIAEATKDPNAAARSWLSAAEIWEGRLGDDEKAQAAYARALGQRATDLSAWDGLARIAERRGAYRDLEQAYRLRIEREEAEGGFKLHLRVALAELLARRVLADEPSRDPSTQAAEEKAASVALEAVVAEAPAHLATLRLLEAIYRKTGNEIALARTLTSLAQAVRDPLAKRGVLWDLVRLQERTDEGVAASPPIAAYLLVFELDQTDEAALAAIVRHAGDRLRDGTSEDGMPNVRGLLAFGLKKQIALAPDAISSAFLELRLADLLEDSIDKREIGEALKLYRLALSRDPESPTAIAGVRRVGALLNDLPAQLAAERAAAEIALDRQTKVGHLLRGAELARRVPAQGGGDDVAIELVVRALREDPDSAEAAAAASALFLGRGDARRLVDVLMEAAGSAKRPDRIVALAREGAHHASSALGNVPVAIALLSQAREADPKDATLLTELGDLYVQQRAWSDAARSYSESVKHANDMPAIAIRAHRALAQLYEGPLEDPKAALGELRLVCKLAPDDVDAQRRLASVLEAQGDHEGALHALEALVAAPHLSARERIDSFARISEIKTNKGDLRGAEQALERALVLDTDPAHEPFARLAAFHARHGGDPAMATALGRLVAEKSADPRWIRVLGEIEMHRIGRPTEGLAHLRQAVQVAEGAARAGDARADVDAAQLAYSEGLLAVGAHDDAVRTARDVLARDPSNAGALSAAGRALTALGRRDEALVCEEVRAYFGYEGSPQTYRARRLHPTPPRSQALEDVAIHAHVMPNPAKTTAYGWFTPSPISW
jgi:tetratricopeptide (TPR) repeat protein